MRALFLVIACACFILVGDLLISQPAREAAATAQTTRTAVKINSPRSFVAQSPVGYFRELLALAPAEREQALAKKSEPHRRYLLAKVQEYEALNPDDRELRLRLVEVHWFLEPLMRLTPSNRVERLKVVPPEDRRIVEQRLSQWDRLPGETQREFLAYLRTISYSTRLESSVNPAQRDDVFKNIAPAQRQKLREELDRWNRLPEERRRRMLGYFQDFFQLSEKERARILNVLSLQDRRAMENTLRAFESLPSAQRELCIESFQKFTTLSPRERDQFLANAERWRALTPSERETWRTLVTQLPPLPPGFGEMQLPPLPAPLASQLPAVP
jgi:hypothetical protein